ncbi:MAG: hypothetical protein P8N50_11775 [Actinomycetota bacterium]|jgi:uncharacterized membrane protein YdjX (TVP38/TMEM64 family)|nr:hypothetical protein [Actinomycetota bacterium]
MLILALAIIIDQQRRRSGASPAVFPTRGAKSSVALILVVLVFLALFAGGIILRNAYDVAWGPVATGAVAAIALFLVSESDRRLQLG